MRQPLTARQLVVILVAVGLLFLAVRSANHAGRQAERQQQVTACLGNAPIGWDCNEYPTNYPGYH